MVRIIERIGIADSDLRGLLDLVDPARCGERGAHVPDSLLRDLPRAIGCDVATFQVMDPYRWEGEVQALEDDPLDDLPDVDRLSRAAFWEAWSYPQRSGDFVTVTRSSDRIPGVQRGRCFDAYIEARGDRPAGAAHVPFPSGAVDHRLLLWRLDGADFTDRDVQLLGLLRPPLVRLYRLHQRAISRAGAPALTARQWQVVRLMAAGDSNRQMARALVLSEATVRKHLENIYARLEVNSRTEALARVGYLTDEAVPPITQGT